MCEHAKGHVQNIAYEIKNLKASKWGEVKLIFLKLESLNLWESHKNTTRFQNCEWKSPIKITQVEKDYK